MGQKVSVDQVVLNMQLKSKELERASKKCEKDSTIQIEKTKLALQKKNPETALIHAQNSVRKKQESLNYLRLASKMDAAAVQLNAAESSQQMSLQVKTVLPKIKSSVERVEGATWNQDMEELEKVIQELDGRAPASSTELNQSISVENAIDLEAERLVQKIADENCLELRRDETPLQYTDEAEVFNN